MRVATFNIRNMVALDWNSFWFRRRSRLAAAIRGIDVDVWAMQEAYKPLVRYLKRRALPGWTVVGRGCSIRSGGEACPIWIRPDRSLLDWITLWFGDRPEEAGSRLAGASTPRVATIAVVDGPDGRMVVANTHLGEKSMARRRASLVQLLDWLSDHYTDLPQVVLGDLNATLDSPPVQALLYAGYVAALTLEDGPTSNGFGDEEHAKQIDQVFASAGLRFGEVSIRRDIGMVSDHWPVLADVHPQHRVLAVATASSVERAACTWSDVGPGQASSAKPLLAGLVALDDEWFGSLEIASGPDSDLEVAEVAGVGYVLGEALLELDRGGALTVRG